MRSLFAYPNEYGNSSGSEMFRGQNHGFTQNNQNPSMSQNNNLGQVNQGGLVQGGVNQSPVQGNGSATGQTRRRGRGFASMDPQRVSEIASMGGKAAHQQGVAHEWTTEEARRAGRKGGQASRGNQSSEQGGS